MVVLMPIERETLQVVVVVVFFYYLILFYFFVFCFIYIYFSQMFNVSTFGNTADIYAIVRLIPHACQHITVDQSHSTGDTVAKILEISGEWRHKDSVLHKPP